jgi:hypothetical protein
VVVAGEPRGKTPLTLELPAGAHDLELRMARYISRVESVRGAPGERLAVRGVLAEAATELELKATPAWAELELSGVGAVSAGVVAVAPGSYRLAARAKGYKPQEREVTADKSLRTQVEVRLEPVAGVLILSANREGARVLIDGAEVGAAGAYEVAPGRRTVRVEAPGYNSYEAALDFVVGEELSAEVLLRAAPRDKTRRLLKLGAVAGGVALASGALAAAEIRRLGSEDAGPFAQAAGIAALGLADAAAAVAIGCAAIALPRYLREGASTARIARRAP